MSQKKYVVLDRDGVINQDSDTFIKSPDEWQPIENSLEAIALLNRHHYAIVVISNQSGIARGYFDEAELNAIHAKMQAMLADIGGNIAAIYYCPHGPDSVCDCRKPKPGLFLQFAGDTGAELAETWCVGDSLRDIQAAQAAGGKPILVLTGKGAQTLCNNPLLNIPVFENLYDAAQYICSTR
jgi:D-glycero-D-manno-heptose 1,7-bisphosphate phosphatase